MTNETNNNPTVITTASGAVRVVDGPLTTTAINEGSPSLLLNEIDSRVVKIRPMATPVDQISRMIGSRQASSMIVDYYSVDAKTPDTELSEPLAIVRGGSFGGMPTYKMTVADPTAIAQTETLLLPEVKAGANAAQGLVVYVVSADSAGDGTATVVCLNGSATSVAESIGAEGNKVVRMGRAAGELDVQTPQFESLPVKTSNFCQIFKAQIEQSILAKLSAKEVGWTLSDQEEVAIMDMRLGMEKSFLFGVKARLTDSKRCDEVLFTQGIWNQAGATFAINAATFGSEQLIAMMRKAFTGDSSGSSRKILMAGSGLIEKLNNLDYTKMITAADTVTRWGIDFSELRSKFGSLYVVLNEVFDQCGHADDGMIIDPQYLTKYSHIPFKVEHLDLKKSGVRNTDALVATEASCLVLRHPKAHLRVTMA